MSDDQLKIVQFEPKKKEENVEFDAEVRSKLDLLSKELETSVKEVYGILVMDDGTVKYVCINQNTDPTSILGFVSMLEAKIKFLITGT